MAQSVLERLALAGCVAADEEADELLATAPDTATLELWVRRRERGEPLAWVTGQVRFCGLGLKVLPGVYVPRPQTEVLAARAAELLPRGGSAADLCTGSGAVAVYLGHAVPGAKVVAGDIDPLAAQCARANGVMAALCDLGSAFRSNSFDVITAVTPYVPTGALELLSSDVRAYEPRLALDGGEDGLEAIGRLIEQSMRLLNPGGWLLTEIGGDQGRAVTALLSGAQFGRPEFWYDEEGDLRGFAAQSQA